MRDRRSWRLLRNPGSKRDYTDDETKDRQLRTLRHSTNWQPIGEWSRLTQWTSRQTDVPQSSQEALRSRDKYYIRRDRSHLSQREAWEIVKLQNVGTHRPSDACHHQEEIVLKSTPFNQLSGVLRWLPHLTRSHWRKLLPPWTPENLCGLEGLLSILSTILLVLPRLHVSPSSLPHQDSVTSALTTAIQS